MQIKNLIEQLTALYNTYTPEDKETMGEPEIMIDIFRLVTQQPLANRLLREYAGFSGKIVITNSACGSYPILSAFDEDQNQDHQAAQSASSTSQTAQGR